MSRYLGIDLGTSYFKAGIYDDAGRLCGLGREAVPKRTDGARCELPAEDFWKALKSAIAQALSQAGIPAAAIDALSYSSQANSFILLDAAGEPLTPLVLWPDGRASDDCQALQHLTIRPDFLEKTGVGVTPNHEWMVAKIDWFQHNQPEIWSKTASVMTISDYLVYGLTGRKEGDCSTAAMTAMLDVRQGSWWNEVLETVGIKKSMLSKPHPTGTPAGKVTDGGTEKSGLKAGTTLFLGSLDHYAVAIGAGITTTRISESCGTVLACVGYAEGYHPTEDVITAPGLAPDRYFQLAFDGNGATAVEWYQKNYAPEMTIAQLEAAASKVPAGCDGLTALPQSDKYPGLSGFKNIKPEHTPGHFLRAIFESTAKTLVALVDKLDPEKKVTELIPSGGGARNPLWLEIKADMLGRKYIPQPTGELATKGAALICKNQNDKI